MRSNWGAVLLDVDGTLLDSNEAHARSWVDVLSRHGYEVSQARVRALIGKGADKLLPELICLNPNDPLFGRMTEERTALFLDSYPPALRPTAGARALLEHMKAEGLRLVVATSASKELPALQRQAGIDDLIDHAATSEDAEDSKPDADIVQAALTKAGVAAPLAVMVGDTPYDVEDASRAGVASVVLRCGGWWRDDDFAGALCIFEDPADWLQHWPGPSRAA